MVPLEPFAAVIVALLQKEPAPLTVTVVGKGLIEKLEALVTEPPGAVTFIVPVVPDAGVAVICVAELTVKEVAAVPPNVTAVAPVKLVPVITTGVVFAHPLEGVKLVIVGAACIGFNAIKIPPFLSAPLRVADPLPVLPATAFIAHAAPIVELPVL